ncbi:MAG: menaquinone-specific isochorismate synthase, partial [Thermoleophilaceae bacterium]|nr:menaquinone-specific isochorismate synthase [Thermoleophilaceae bacterium]
MTLTATEGVLDRLRELLQRAPLASVTVPLPPELDVSAVVLAARRPDDRFFCFEQPDRGFALAGLGAAAVVEARGSGRFASVAAQCREFAHDLPFDDPGPVWVGGFAFSPDGGLTPEWSSLAPGQLVLPEVLLRRERGEAWMTVTARSADDAEQRVSELRHSSMPLFDPDPLQRARVSSAAPPEHFESAIERAVERIAAGELRKVVLAREVRVHSPVEIDPGPVFDGLRVGFPSCYCYLVGSPELAFVGASPELLVRRDGQRVQTVALAGTRRRSADPAVDSHLGEQLLQSPKDREEQAIVTRRIKRALGPVSVWVTAADEPVLVKVLNVQHLGTPIRAQLAEPLSVVELAGRLHPTPAVGGEPAERALPLIPALEGLDRGWYAGPVGWTDMYEDGELCVALRCALLRGRVAHLYAGEGIVRDSVASEELAA